MSKNEVKDMKVILKCNPYTKENKIIINGSEYDKNSILQKYTNINVYQFGEDFVNDLVNELNSKEIHIEFEGSMYDYEELSSIVKKVNENKEYMITLNAKHKFENLGRRKEIEQLLVQIKESEIKEFKDAKLIEKIQDSLNKKVEVAVIAPMSSGKSTLINALVGDKLMPSQSDACTATIVTISNDKSISEFRIVKENNKKCDKAVSLEVLTELNKNININTIDVVGNILGLSDISNLKIVDTPGPNNAANEEHKKTTMNYIKSSEKPIILFVIDNNQQTSEEVKSLIITVADEMKRDGKVDEDRFLFIINKCDSFKKEDNVENMKNTMVKFIQDCGVSNPRIHFVSSYNALLSRMILNNKKLPHYEAIDYEGICAKAIGKSYEFHRQSIFESRLKETIDLDIEATFKDINEKKIKKSEYDIIALQLAAFESMPAIPLGFETQIEAIKKDATAKKGAKEEYEKSVAELVLLTSGVIGLERNIEDIINQHKSVKLVWEIVENCRNIIEAQNIKKKLKESINKGTEQREKIKESIAKIEEKLNYNKLKDVFEKEINDIKFGNSFKNVIDRVNRETRQFHSIIKDLPRAELKNKDGEYVDRAIAEKGLLEVNNRANFLKVDIETEYERFIKVEIKEVGNELVNKYKKYIENIIGEIKGLDKNINNLVKVSIPNYNEFIERNTVEKSECYNKIIDNPERDGFFGKLKFWKPKKIEVTGEREIKVINVDELKKFTIDLETTFQDMITKMVRESNKEKENVKKTLLENVSVLDEKIHENLSNLKSMMNDKVNLEVAIDSDIKIENKLDKIIKYLDSIIRI